VTSPVTERAAAACLFWARPCRRSDDAIAGSVAGLSAVERAEVVALLEAGVHNELTDDELVATMTELATKSRRPIQRKTIRYGENKTITLDRAPIDTSFGELTGYASTWGRDREGDHIMPGAFSAAVAQVNAGRLVLPLTDGHDYEDVSATIGRVVEAKEDHVGLWIRAALSGDEHAQRLRPKLGNVGLSIGYRMLTPAQPRPGGGRNLHAIDLLHVAVTPSPMNPETRVLSVKTAAGNVSWAPVLTVAENTAVEAHRNDPARQQREQKARTVAASWLSPALQAALSVEDAYDVVMGAAAAKATREAAPDEATRLRQARRQKANDYDNQMRRWKETMTTCEHRSCMPGRCSYR
jgi:HK97 family phage prohead protease